MAEIATRTRDASRWRPDMIAPTSSGVPPSSSTILSASASASGRVMTAPFAAPGLRDALLAPDDGGPHRGGGEADGLERVGTGRHQAAAGGVAAGPGPEPPALVALLGH